MAMVENRGYRLMVEPLEGGEYALELRIEPVPDSKAPPRRRTRSISTMSGWHLSLAEGFVRRSLVKEGYNPSGLKCSRKTPFKLGEEHGVKVHLIFEAIRDLKKRSKIEDVILGIEGMSREEALYWHSKVRHDPPRGERRGMKALRMLMGGE